MNSFIHNTAFAVGEIPIVDSVQPFTVETIITAGTSIENQTNDETDSAKWGVGYIKNKYGVDVELLDVAVGGSRIQELVATLPDHLIQYADRKNVVLMLNHGFNDTNNGTFLSMTQQEQDTKNDDLRYVYDFALQHGWRVVQGSITHSSYTNVANPEGIFRANPLDVVTNYGPFDYIRDWIVPIMKEYIPAYVRNDSDLSIDWPVVDSWNTTRNIHDAWRDPNDLPDYVHPSSFGRIIHLTTQLDGVMTLAAGQLPQEVTKRDYNATYTQANSVDMVFGFNLAANVAGSTANINWLEAANGSFDDVLYLSNVVDVNGNALPSVKIYSYADIAQSSGASGSDTTSTLNNSALLSGALGKQETLPAGSTTQPAMHIMVEGLQPMRLYNMEFIASAASGTKEQIVFLHDGNPSDSIPQVNASVPTSINADFLTDYLGRAFVAVEPVTNDSYISGLRISSTGEVDSTIPVITLIGPSTVSINIGDTYTESGATALDNADGDITDLIVITGSVDTATAGTYTINYNVADLSGNAAAQVTRTVLVAVAPDTTAPVINLTPNQTEFTITVGESFTPPTAIATDNIDANAVVTPVDVDSFDNNTVGVYTFTYDHADASGNAATQVVVTVNVISVDTLLSEVAQTRFSFDESKVYFAFSDSSNIEVLKFIPIGDNPNIDVDADGYFSFTDNNISKVEVIAGSETIDSDSSYVFFEDSELRIKFSGFSENTGLTSVTIKVFIGSDTQGTVIAGPGLESSMVVFFQ
jgi:hypothetical protein